MVLDIKFEQIEQYISKLDKFDNVAEKIIVRFLDKAGVEISSIIKEKFLSGQLLKVRTGRLRNSIGAKNSKDGIYKLRKSKGQVVLQVGTRVKYAKIHEFGGTIRAKKSKYLTIPINRKLFTPTGAPRFYWNAPGDIKRQFPNLFVIKSKNGNLLLVRKIDKKSVEPYFLLKKQVNIKEKGFMRRGLETYRKKLNRVDLNQLMLKIARELA